MNDDPARTPPRSPKYRLCAGLALALNSLMASAWDIGYLNDQPVSPSGAQSRSSAKSAFKGLDTLDAKEVSKRIERMPLPQPKANAGDAAARKVAKELKQLWAIDQGRVKSTRGIAAYSHSAALGVRGASVRVRVHPAAGVSGTELADAVRSAGAEVTLMQDGVVYASTPIANIPALGELGAVGYLAGETKLEPLAVELAEDGGGTGPATSDGVPAMKVEHLRKEGIRGKGVRVGILDMGFARYDELTRQGELPRNALTQAFGNDAFGDESLGPHGSAVAEIVHDVAPDATLLLAQFDGYDSTMMEGAKWLAEQGVQVINASFGSRALPTNGMSRQDRFVDALVKQYGIVWINAAGNEGHEQWTAMAEDRDHNGLVDVVVDGSNRNGLKLTTGDGPWNVTVIWDDWGADPVHPAANQDIDVFIVIPDPVTGELEAVMQSTEVQDGHQEPRETISADMGLLSESALLVIRATRVDRPVRVRVVPNGATIEPTVPAYSLSSPASAHASIAVGAVDVKTGAITHYSSQGPTDDGRMKPEISAPTNTISVAYGKRFHGTSSAAPHAAGFAALLRQLEPAADVDRIRRQLQGNVHPIGASPNPAYGYGHLDGSHLRAAAPPPETPPQRPEPRPEPTPPPPITGHTLDDDKLRKLLDQW